MDKGDFIEMGKDWLADKGYELDEDESNEFVVDWDTVEFDEDLGWLVLAHEDGIDYELTNDGTDNIAIHRI